MITKLGINIIDTHDFKTLGLLDVSQYNPNIVVEQATIEIFPPGFSLAASPYFMFGALNVYNSNGLGLTRASCEEELVNLPDGIWKIKYSICPNDKLFIEKIFLKTDKLRCKFNQAFLTLDLSCDSDLTDSNNKKKLKKIQEIEQYIQGAIAASNQENAKLATDLYKKADQLLDKLVQAKNFCGC